MRELLKPLLGKRARYSATFIRFGERESFKGPPKQTALFQNICLAQGEEVTDHLWFTVGARLRRLNLKPNDRIAFDATVRKYKKGYRGHRRDDDFYDDRPAPTTDYRLSNPTKLVKIVIAHAFDSPATDRLIHVQLAMPYEEQ